MYFMNLYEITKFIFTEIYFHRKISLFTKILYYENWSYMVNDFVIMHINLCGN